LNEFINYSRPREVRRSPLALNAIIAEVVRALSYDIQEKKILLEVKGERIAIEADEQLLRQVLFNLVINAIQAVGGGGEIQILTQRRNASEGSIEIRDNGPGVPPERRAEIFKPYFTTQAKGTGLGLAIVQQNVLAHGWEIEVLANEPKGAIFRVTHLKLAKS
jgi:signal transduction histidine kinase